MDKTDFFLAFSFGIFVGLAMGVIMAVILLVWLGA